MFVNKENAADIEKYFKNTYIRCREIAEDMVLRVTNVTQSHVTCLDCNNETSLIDLNLGYYIDTPLPNKVTFSGPDGRALHIYRKPLRKWKKGICSENTGIRALNDEGSWSSELEGISFGILFKYITKETPNTFENIHVWINTKQSYSLGHRWSMSNNGFLFLDTTKVGTLDVANKVGIIKRAFKEEFTELNKGVFNVIFK